MKAETKTALLEACRLHPTFAEALAGLLDPKPRTLGPRRVKRTSTTAKILRTG